MIGGIVGFALLGWIAFGYLGVLVTIGYWKRFYYEHPYVGWETAGINTLLTALIFITGPIGFLIAIIESLSDYGKIHVAIHIPNEIRAPTKESQLLDMATQMIAEGDFSRVEDINVEIDELRGEKAKKAEELKKRVFI